MQAQNLEYLLIQFLFKVLKCLHDILYSLTEHQNMPIELLFYLIVLFLYQPGLYYFVYFLSIGFILGQLNE